MQNFIVEPAHRTPAIRFAPDEHVFYIRGTSSPEDVRTMYYPALEWINTFIDEIFKGKFNNYSKENPVKFQMDLDYFNSASAKFFFDILTGFKKLHSASLPVIVEWYYDEEDADMKEAGDDFAKLLEMEFTFIPKTS